MMNDDFDLTNLKLNNDHVPSWMTTERIYLQNQMSWEETFEFYSIQLTVLQKANLRNWSSITEITIHSKQ